MNDQILVQFKNSDKKDKSRNSLISSGSVAKDKSKLNEFLNGENATVYALVEVSNDSESPGKREKIPLNNKEFFKILQKFINSQKFKPERKIVKPSKRKHSTDPGQQNSAGRSNQNKALLPPPFELSDNTTVIYKRGNFGESDRSKERDNPNRRCVHSSDSNASETKSNHLKMLFQRNHLGSIEPVVKRERLGLPRQSMNQEIAHTSKALEKAIQVLTLNVDAEKPETITVQSPKKGVYVENGKEVNRKSSSDQNFLYGPFIITNNSGPQNQKSGCRNKRKYVNQDAVDFRADTSTGESHKKLEGSTAHNDNVSRKSARGTENNSNVKNEPEAAKEGESNGKRGNHAEPGENKRDCLLKEVKRLQHRINAIVDGLETDNFICKHSFVNSIRDNEAIPSREHDADNENRKSSKGEFSNDKPSTSHYQDCGVQAVMMKSLCDKTVTVPSALAVKALTSKLIQFPSEVKFENQITAARVTLSKSTPLIATKFEWRYIKSKRVSSLLYLGKRNEDWEYLGRTNFNRNCEGSLVKNQSRSDHDSGFESIKKRINSNTRRPEKSMNVLFRQNNVSFLPGNQKDKLVTVKQCGKTAKIKIVGNTTFFSDNRNTRNDRMDLELNELGNLKLMNKCVRKPKNIDNNINNNNSVSKNNGNNSSDNKSKVADSSLKSNVNNEESNKKFIEIGTLRKVSRKEFIHKKCDFAEPVTRSMIPSIKETANAGNKVKRKPSKPVRMLPKGKETPPAKSQPSPPPQTQKDSTPAAKKEDDPQSTKSPKVTSPIKKSPSPVNNPRCEKIPEPESKAEKPCEEIAENPGDKEASSSEVVKRSSPVKSIWALTKVVVYEDGTQSFKVVEASSQPLRFNKITGNNDGKDSKINVKTCNESKDQKSVTKASNECKDSRISMKPSNDCKVLYSSEDKSH